jgi:hypothetical protein
MVSPGGAMTVADATLEAATNTINGVLPTRAMMGGVSDGTDLRARRGSKQGIAYAIPTAPNTATGDRPPVELQWANVNGATSTGPVVAAPGAGLQIRVFFISAYANNSSASYYISANNAAGAALVLCDSGIAAGGTPLPLMLPLTGLLCETNTAVSIVVAAGAAGATIAYTVETV